jgi:hypothetical protein
LRHDIFEAHAPKSLISFVILNSEYSLSLSFYSSHSPPSFSLPPSHFLHVHLSLQRTPSRVRSLACRETHLLILLAPRWHTLNQSSMACMHTSCASAAAHTACQRHCRRLWRARTAWSCCTPASRTPFCSRGRCCNTMQRAAAVVGAVAAATRP